MLSALACAAVACAAKTCNVLDFGGKGDGRANDTHAVQTATDACASEANSTVLLPAGKTFLSWPITVAESSWLRFQVDGTMLAPGDPAAWGSKVPEYYLSFEKSPGLVLAGNGTINGNGSAWWAIRKSDPSHAAPKLVAISSSSGITVANVSLLSSPMFHLVLNSVFDSVVDGISISAPQSSPNTDGIDPGSSSSRLVIRNVYISNGDDCIAIKSGSADIHVDNATCINGHGISIGSLGENDSEGDVNNITVTNSRFATSQNGCRIKTWQGGSGEVRNITFENVTMADVENPIRINQFYCPSSQHPKPCTNSSKAVKVSYATFRGITGTHTEDVAAAVLCSDSVPCHNITLQNIDLQPSKSGAPSEFQCWQAFGLASNVTPSACLWGP